MNSMHWTVDTGRPLSFESQRDYIFSYDAKQCCELNSYTVDHKTWHFIFDYNFGYSLNRFL